MTDSQFFFGSRLLEPFSRSTGLSLDQLNFVVCQLACVVFGLMYRFLLPPSRTSPTTRMAVSTILGFAIAYFCFGRQVMYMFVLSAICYLLMRIGPRNHFHWLTFVASMGMLAYTHLYRQIYDYGGYTLDITGPLMILVQRMSSLAYNLHDGMVPRETLNEMQFKYVVSFVFPCIFRIWAAVLSKMPSLLEFYSYVFHFHGILAGPMFFYIDYIEFVDPRNVRRREKFGVVCDPLNQPEYLPWSHFISAFVVCLINIAIYQLVMPYFPTDFLAERGYAESSFTFKLYYLLVSLTIIKQRYYFAWKLAEAINLATGIGFSGYDINGKPKFENACNVHILGVELSTSIKMNMDSWNIQTLRWLRICVYDRARYYPTMAMRRSVRPYFTHNHRAKLFYDCVTFWATRWANVYLAAGFVLLDIHRVFLFYWTQRFWLHIILFVLFLVVPAGRSSSGSRQATAANEDKKDQ